MAHFYNVDQEKERLLSAEWEIFAVNRDGNGQCATWAVKGLNHMNDRRECRISLERDFEDDRVGSVHRVVERERDGRGV